MRNTPQDWAPYSRMRDADGNPMFTKGIWRSVYVVAVPETLPVAITHLAPLVYYSGADWPTSAMADGSASFMVVCRVFLLAEGGINGTIFAEGSWGDSATAQVSLNAGENMFNV